VNVEGGSGASCVRIKVRTDTTKLSDMVIASISKDAKYCHDRVCLSVCPRAYLTDHSPNFMKFAVMLIVAVARTFSNENAICYVLPVLCITSYLPIMDHTARG